MSERSPGLLASDSSIAITSVYPEGYHGGKQRYGGVQNVIRMQAEDYETLGFVNTAAYTPDLWRREPGQRDFSKSSETSVLPISFKGTSAYIGIPTLSRNREILDADVMHGHEPFIDVAQQQHFYGRRGSANKINIATLHASTSDKYLKTFEPEAAVARWIGLLDNTSTVC
mgnify:CR=1 FL=1